MIIMRIQVIIFFLIAPLWLQAQNVLKGTVINQEKEPLAFVNILINNEPQNGVFTDIDGQFEINSEKSIQSLQLTYVGYQALDYQLSTNDFSNENFILILQESSINLIEAVVIAGENPAHRIIKKVVENRNANNPEKWSSFQCDTYNKMTFEFLPNMKAQAEKESKNEQQGWFGKRQDTVTNMYNKFAQKRHLAVMETVTQKSFLAPNHHKELVLNNRVSGFTEPQFVALAKDAQPFSFYETYIDVLGQNYLNPISIGSTSQYFFEIKDTLYQQQDSIFIISYKPKKGKTFDGLKGVLYINTNQYALQNVIAEPSDVNKTNLKIEQKYALIPDGKWFPEQLNFEWMMPQYPMPNMGLKIIGKSYISNVDLAPNLKRKEFTADKYTLAEDVYNKADTIWNNARIDPLTSKENDTYIWMDSVSEAKNIEAKFKLLEALISRKYQVNKIDIDLPRLASFNEYESVRLGLGFHTNDKFHKRIKLGGYVGNGFRDEAIKYGGDLSFLINKKRNFLIVTFCGERKKA